MSNTAVNNFLLMLTRGRD